MFTLFIRHLWEKGVLIKYFPLMALISQIKTQIFFVSILHLRILLLSAGQKSLISPAERSRKNAEFCDPNFPYDHFNINTAVLYGEQLNFPFSAMIFPTPNIFLSTIPVEDNVATTSLLLTLFTTNTLSVPFERM